MSTSARQEHWDNRYRTVGAESVSWFAPTPKVSLEILDALDVGPRTSVIDVGGGAARLVDALVDRCFDDLTVLDVSRAALDLAAVRVGREAATWLHRDLLTWEPDRTYGLWHDRAVFHFLTDRRDRTRYQNTLLATVESGGLVVVAAFAPDGPEQCSGLPVQRYDAAGLATVLGPAFVPVLDRREDHITPSGGVQPFTWAAFRTQT